MKAGVNVWRALHNNQCVHRAWMHLAAKPLTEADLPRAIEAIGPDSTLAADAAAAKAGDEGIGAAAKPVARKLTVEVKAYTESSQLTDDQLADLAH
jgi:hypothetical protein